MEKKSTDESDEVKIENEEEVKVEDEDEEEEFIALDPKNKPIEINFCSDFDDDQTKKFEKRKAKEKRKKSAKKVRLTRKNSDLPPADFPLIWKSEKSLLNVSSRKTIGFVVNGNFSFRLGKGFGLGFLSAEAVIRSCLEGPMQSWKFLYRNSSSVCYRFAIVDFVFAPIGY